MEETLRLTRLRLPEGSKRVPYRRSLGIVMEVYWHFDSRHDVIILKHIFISILNNTVTSVRKNE